MLDLGFKRYAAALTLLVALLDAPAASAAVSVTIPDDHTAVATINLTDASSNSYSAVVTIVFDQDPTPLNLSAGSLNLTAQLIDPTHPPGTLPANVSVDPAFPVLVSVEPPVALFMNSYEDNQSGDGNLAFFNTYELEIHTPDLACSSSTSTYRLYKAPHGSTVFTDYTDDLFQGSVRARGRGGSFSQFIVVRDNRPQTLLGVPLIATEKLLNLTTRLNLATILNPGLLTALTGALTNVAADLLTLNIGAALGDLQIFIDGVVTGAQNGDIANEWKSDRSVNNDAGDLLGLAQTLQFTLRLLQSGNALCLPPPS
jgi:hypothetical protein